MQAEGTSKWAATGSLRRQFPDRFPAELLRLLFERTRIDSRLAGDGRIYIARRVAMRRSSAGGSSSRCETRRGGRKVEVLAELRRFYRLTNARKLAHIQRTA